MIMLALIALFSPSARAVTNEIVPVTYEVPAPDSLKSFAQVILSYQIVQGQDYGTQVSYTLPATLLGHERAFTLNGTADPAEDGSKFTGPDADMTCSTSNTSVICKVTHHNVVIDLPAVKAALEATSLSQAQKEGRFQLASFVARMGGDLVGVITYPRKIPCSNASPE